MRHSPTVTTIQQQEAQRRLKLLGTLADAPYDYQQLQQRAKEVFVPTRVLWNWWQQYQESKLDGLLPTDWNLSEITAKMQVIIDRRLAQLAAIHQVDVITSEYVQRLVTQNHWSLRTAGRWIQRYQIGGWWGLAPAHDPEKVRQVKAYSQPPALGALDDETLEKTFLRRERLGRLANLPVVSRTALAWQAERVGIAERILWHYLQRYRQNRLTGLAPKTRSDKGSHHKITPHMIEVVRGIRFDQPGKSVRAVYETAVEKAQILGEVTPSRWQVRRICAEISEPERLLTDGRDDLFRNYYEVTRSLEAQRQKSRLIVYQIDPTRVNVLVKDLRKPSCRSKSGMVRPWLTVCFDSRSRLVLAAIFTYDHPNRYTIAAVIRDAVLAPKTKPYGGVPHEIWIDRGKELLSHHVEQLTQELQIQLHKCHRHRPQEKGLIERFFRTLNTRFWSTQPGYVGSNVVERNPHVKAALTMQELEQRFWEFIERYHHEVHSQTHEAPLDYWQKHCHAESPDPRELDILLQEPVNRKIHRIGIRYEDRFYWSPAIAKLTGMWVVIRAAPHYWAPDQIEVFSKKRWLCTAKATDSPDEQEVTRENIIAAKKSQKAFHRQNIQKAREALAATNRAITELTKKTATSISPSDQPSAPPTDSEKKLKPTRPSDFLDEMAKQESAAKAGER